MPTDRIGASRASLRCRMNRLAFDPRGNSGWPGQCRGDTVFATGEIGAVWFARIPIARSMLVGACFRDLCSARAEERD